MNLNPTQPSLGGGRNDTERGFRSKTFSVSQSGIPRRTFFQNAKVLQNFIVLTSYYLDKSRHNLETAGLLFNLSENSESKKAFKLREDYHAYDWVISASYYSMFHASTAALGSLGLRARSHECLIEVLEYLFVHKRKILETEMIEKIIRLKSLEKRYIDRMWSIKSRRNVAHYKAEETISRSDAQKSLKDAYEFVERMEELMDDLKE